MSKEAAVTELEPYSFERLNRDLQTVKTLLNDTVWSEAVKLASVIDQAIPDSLYDKLKPSAEGEKVSRPGMIEAIDNARQLRVMVETVAEYLKTRGGVLHPENY